jgi:hypothetical protein
MADGTDTGVPWYGWLILAFHLIVTIGILWMTHSTVVPPTVAWIVTGVWALGTAIMGLVDFVISRDSPDVDATAFDRWSIVHTAAGIVFGIWYIPLIFVLIVVFLWECFEFSVTGFGDQETILNKLTDMGVAVVGWGVVILVLMLTTHAPFPLASPVQTSSAQQQPVKTTHQAAPPHSKPTK